jgi:hypothetical protein
MRILAPLMKLIRQLGFLRLGADASKPKLEVDDDRVMHLFRNRAELKKAHSSLQDELQRLKDRVKQQEGATARVQEMLQGLEGRLGQPDSAYPAIVFYQLRELWTLGRTLIAQFIAELSAQLEERERRAFLADYNRKQFNRRQSVEANLREAELQAAAGRDAVQLLEQQQQRLQRFWHYFKRRELRQRLQAATLQSMLRVQELEAARIARDVVEAEPAPEFAGLSIDARRAINMAAVAYAQVLVERLSETPLMEMAREAAGRREPPRDDNGDRARCELTMQQIAYSRGLLENKAGVGEQVKQYAARLRELSKYRNGSDTVPTPDSLASSIEGGSKVLADDLWEIFRVLLH